MSHVNPGSEYPVEPKVKAATALSGIVSLLLFGLLTIVQDERVPLLIGFLPEAVEPFVLALLPALGSLIAGYYAAHQHRRMGPATAPHEG